MSLNTQPQEYVELAELNTLRVAAIARYYLEVRDAEELSEALAWAERQELRT